MLKTSLLILLILLVSCRNPLRSHINEQRQSGSVKIGQDLSQNGVLPYRNLFTLYDRLRTALANDEFKLVKEVVSAMDTEIQELLKSDETGNGKILLAIYQSVPSLLVAQGTDAIRQAFGALSEAVVDLYKDVKTPFLDLYHCPMAKGYGYWLQAKGTTISNPYMGLSMQKCGSLVNGS